MKKFTLLTLAAMAFASFNANAELQDKYFYKVATDKADGWSVQDAGNTQFTPTSDYLQVYLVKNAGRMLNRFWNEDAWTKTDVNNLPNNTYKFTMDLKMTSMATRSDMEFTLLPVGACSETDSRVSTHNYHWWNAQDGPDATEETVKEDYFFRWRVVTAPAEANGDFTILINENPTGRGDWTTSENPDSLCTLSSNVKYTFAVNINVAEKVAAYTITAEDGTEVKSGSHAYVCEENRAGIMVFSMNGQSTHQISNLGLSYLAEGPFAVEPTADLFWVEGTERDYFVQFQEGDVLHWIQLGDAEDVVSGNSYSNGEEYTVSWGDAMDSKDFEMGEENGRKIITCTESGQLKIWTSRADDDSNTSDDVVIDVECVEIQLPTPTATITNVSAGYGKEYTLTVDNSTVALSPTITIHYVLTDNGSKTEGDVLSGEVIAFKGNGTLEVYSWDKTHLTECYTRSEVVTINNDVKYVEYSKTDFAWSKEMCDREDLPGYTRLEIVDNSNKSHWDRIYSDQKYGYNKDGNAEVYDAAKDETGEYVYVKEGFNFYAGTAIGTDDAKWNVQVPNDIYTGLSPMVPVPQEGVDYTENAWSIFPLEGIVYYAVSDGNVIKNDAGAAGYLRMKLEDRFTSDNEAKPNFYIVHTRNGYDRPDKGDCNHTQVLIAGQTYWLYRYDTAICDVRVMTYEGFTPGEAAIDAIECVKENASTVYGINGVRVENAAAGLYIVGGKVVMVK